MSRKILFAAIILLTAAFIFPSRLGFADEILRLRQFQEEWNLERYVKYFYNRYSTHFDENGLLFSAPEYGTAEWRPPVTAREHISLAMFYKYRAQEGDYKARALLKNSVAAAQKELDGRPLITQSFEDAEAIFLIVRLIETVPEMFAPIERERILDWMAKYAERGIRVADTENRAIISAAHWQYIVDYLNSKEKISNLESKRHSKIIKNKIDFAISTNINREGWYVEGRFNDFTPHYHAVSAYMLMIYSKLTGHRSYGELAFKMFDNLKSVSFDNGMVEARIGHRPAGLGAQFYLMAGMLGKNFNDPVYTTYLFYGSNNRFFTDQNYPNRLEYHSTLEGSPPNFHDDYSFIDAAELALAIPSLLDGNFKFTYQLNIPSLNFSNKYIQKNTGREIIFNGKKIILGTRGNWARIVE